MRGALITVTVCTVGLAALVAASLWMQLALPAPTGPLGVARASFRWTDDTRHEDMTTAPEDRREVVVEAWYPAERGAGTGSRYVPDLERIARGLVESGEVSGLEVFALQFVRTGAHTGTGALEGRRYPIVLLSPGNATNVEFYAALAGELASHGFVVLGINHPYDVAAVALEDGSVARYDEATWPADPSVRGVFATIRVAERAADVRFVMDRLEELDAGPGPLAGALDASRVAVVGHSLGGIAAAEVCRSDARARACVNLDGLQAGGAFGTTAGARAPLQPFLFVTKEAELVPQFSTAFEDAREAYKVVIRGARHDSFTDAQLITPHLLPNEGDADRAMQLTRSFVLGFLEQELTDAASPLLAHPSRGARHWLEVFETP